MKKSLVALAALAVVGAASAQVAITGTTSLGWAHDLSGTNGFDLQDFSVFLTDTEDLGSGTKLVMSTGFQVGGRAYGVTTPALGSEDTSLTVSGGFGAVKLASFESDGPLAPVEALANTSLTTGAFDLKGVDTGKTMRNGAFYTTPSFGGVTATLSYVTLAGSYLNNDSHSSGNKTSLVVKYAAGPLAVAYQFDDLDANYTSIPAADLPATANTLTAIYDFGVAKVGAGYFKPSYSGGTTVLSVNVPVGALTLGLAAFSYNGPDGVFAVGTATNVGNASFTEASVAYALSKRTSLKASFAQVNDAYNTYAANTGYGASNGEYMIGLFHNF